MALTRKEKLKLLSTKSQERAKRFASSGENFGFLNPEKMKEFSLGMFRPKARAEEYYVNVMSYVDSHDQDVTKLEVKTHSIMVNGFYKSVICPKAMFPEKNLPCPICEKRESKMASDPDDSDNTKKLNVKVREIYYLQDVSNKTELSKGIQVFNIAGFYFGWKVRPLTKAIIGGEGIKGTRGDIDITDKEEGRIVQFNVGTKKTDDGVMPDYFGHKLIEREPLSTEIMERMADLPPLEDLLLTLSYDDLYEMVNNEPNEEDQDKNGDNTDSKTDGTKEKSALKRKVEKIKKKKEKSIDLNFDYMKADAEDLEEFIEENDIKINEDHLGNEKKMKIVVKKFIKKMKEEQDNNEESWPSRDDIDDIDDFMDNNEEKLMDFCKFHGIEPDDDEDIDEVKFAIDEWYIG